MKIAALQTDIVWEDPDENFARLRPLIAQARAAGAELVVLPEMFAHGFSMDSQRIREPADGPSARFLADTAREHGLWLCGSFPEHAGGADPRPHNTLLLCAPDGAEHRYRKIHPFSLAGEHEHYQAGRELVTVRVDDLRVSFFICYDLRFADEFWAAAHDTDAYVVVANWPERRRAHWSTLLRARAIENQAYVVGVNRVGEGGGLAYSGDSAVIDPWGEILVEAKKDPSMLLAELDPGRVADARTKLPFLRDRR
ncbi:carbon-nitrogen family hydrolase [Haliangium ochraceum]|uniref:Nitrilase/cyanide hydratase and apolipoprotein N-acyltransferase n=1 Tax=Haliangium ochraceum (strain DSM 14365 / JCM 11303 / SMP-2) TaxID=502025 RepID=D0LKK6_HALO1|nr:carbon-nitrogen family hydrolase [Haliangium ochraceum]ACY15054.1 Nitrilase/cyanide hydratase and apolipoprotein N- acyltransferase [Haliangium ochraceum DSM 14365]